MRESNSVLWKLCINENLRIINFSEHYNFYKKIKMYTFSSVISQKYKKVTLMDVIFLRNVIFIFMYLGKMYFSVWESMKLQAAYYSSVLFPPLTKIHGLVYIYTYIYIDTLYVQK